MSQTIDITSKEAVAEINRIINSFNQMRKSITGVGDGSKASFRKMVTALKGIEQAQLDSISGMIKMDRSLRNMTKSQKSFRTQLKNTKAELAKTNAELEKAQSKLDGYKKKGEGVFSGIRKNVLSLLSAFGLIQGFQMFRNLINESFKLSKKLDSLNFAMKAVITDVKELGQTTVWLKTITEDFGAEIVTTTERYIKFRAASKQANLTADETQKIFGTMTKAAGVLGLKTDELTGIYLALEQMISKGKITTEELRRQLGERLPGAMDIMANSMGVTTAELDDMLKKGEVITKDVLPAFAEEVEKAFGLNSVASVETLQASTIRLKNSFTNLVQEFNEGTGASKTLMDGFNFLAKNLQTISKIVVGLIGVWTIYKVVQATITLQTYLLGGAFKTLRANMVLNIAIARADIATKIAQIVATKGLTGATAGLRAAVILLWTTMVANPIIGLVAVIALATAAMIKFTDTFLETSQEQQRLNQSTTETISKTKQLNQENRDLLSTYDDLKSKTKLTKEEQEELNTVIQKIGKNIPDAIISVDEYSQALGINTDAAREFIKLNEELSSLEAVKVVEDESARLATAKKLTKELNDAKKEGNTIDVDGVGLLQFKDGIFQKVVSSQTGETKNLGTEAKIAFIKYEAGLKSTIAKSTQLIKTNQELIDLELSDPTGEIRKAAAQQEKAEAEAKEAREKKEHYQTISYIDEQIKKKRELINSTSTEVLDDPKADPTPQILANRKKIIVFQKEIEELEDRKNKLLGITNTKQGKSLKQLRIIRDLSLEIANIESKKKILEFDVIANDDTLNFDDRKQAIQDSAKEQLKIEENSSKAKIQILENKATKEALLIEQEIKATKDGTKRKLDLEKQLIDIKTELDQKTTIEKTSLANKEFQIEKSKIDKLKQLNKDYQDTLLHAESNQFANRAISAKNRYNGEVFLANLSMKLADEEFANSDKKAKDKRKRDKAYADAEEKEKLASIALSNEMAEIEFELAEKIIAFKKKALELEFETASDDRKKAIKEEIKDLDESAPTLKLKIKPETDVDEFKKDFDRLLDLAAQFNTALGDLADGIFSSNIENIEAEIEATNDKYDKAIEAAEGNALQQKTLEKDREADIEKLEKKKLKEEQKRAKFRKAQALVDIAINTAVAISAAAKETIFGLSLVPVLVALGALQAAAVLAQPIPKYKDGLENAKKDHIGMINDGGKQEFLERDGQILTTDVKNAVIPINKGDTIYKDYDDLKRKSLLMNGVTNGFQINKIEFGNVFDGIDESIQRGFKKSKINNNIINKIKDNNYANSMTYWG